MKQTSQTSAAKRTTPKTAAPKSRLEIPSSKTTYSHEEYYKKVQEKAYELFLQRHGAPGNPEEDWAQAEKIVKGS